MYEVQCSSQPRTASRPLGNEVLALSSLTPGPAVAVAAGYLLGMSPTSACTLGATCPL